MPNILCINTSNDYLSLAVMRSDGFYEVYQAQVGNSHSEHIIAQIRLLLDKCELKARQLDLIAYIAGPGSFTGLRVGLSVALGMSLGTTAKLVAIPSFALTALASGYKGDMLFGLDARLGEIYLAGINGTTLDYFLEPQVISPGKITAIEGAICIGSGFELYAEHLADAVKEQIRHQQDKYQFSNYTHPSPIYMLDIVRMAKYPQLFAHEAELLYVRDKVALNTQERANIISPK